MPFGSKAFGASAAKVKVSKPGAHIVTVMDAAFRERKARNLAQFKDITDTDFYLVLCFQNSAQVDEIVDYFGLPPKDRFLDGIEVMDRLGIELETATGRLIKRRVDPKLAALTGA